VLAAGCGQGAPSVPAGPAAATVLVTRDFGATELTSARVAPGQSALMALRRSAEVSTSYAGRFVTGIDGLRGSKSDAHDWLYYVNGIDPGIGAADTELHPGDQEWWDYRYWHDFVSIPAVIGAWPEPFVHGLDGHRPRVAVRGPSCAGILRTALRDAGAELGNGGGFEVDVTTFAEQAPVLDDWRVNGFTVRVSGDLVEAYRGEQGWAPVNRAAAVIVARSPQGTPGRSFQLIVAGRDSAAACAGARTLAAGAGIRHAYAVALDEDGRVVAQGGRP
jgi:hypothetical protein